METIFGLFVFIFVILLPAIAIFSFTSTVTRGVYHWAESQSVSTVKPQKKKKSKKSNRVHKKEVVEEYLGYPEQFEDSEEFKQILDNYNFDVQSFLKKR
jgi:hypothetical protein